MSNKTLVILGMHRSGTSLVTQWLYKCGLHVGDNLAGPGLGNIEGHFEDFDFLNLHEEILTANALPPNGLISTHSPDISKHHLQKMETLIESKNRIRKEWGWKEPRTCLFLHEYRHLIPDAKYIILLRDFNDVVDSLIRRDFKNIENKILRSSSSVQRIIWKYYKRKKTLLLLYKEKTEPYLKVWILYNEFLLEHIHSLNRNDFILVNFKSLITQASSVFKHIQLNWGFNLSCTEYNEVYKENLMSSQADLTAFIHDLSLIKRAALLNQKLQKFHFTEKRQEERVE